MVNGTRAAVAITLAISGTAAAQATATGSLRGIITDREFGTPVAEASITVLGTRARGTTSETGAFLIRDVPPGTYTVVIAKDGYVREVRPNVRVGEGALVDLDAAMAGEFEDMEEFVVQDVETAPQDIERQDLVVPEAFEPILVLPPVDFQLRLEAPQLLDVLNVDMINRSGAGDAAAALLLVPGATLQDGKYAVIRGLPDRYVATLLDGVRLPVADPTKRAVKLDQFPAAVIQAIEVSKNFTPDQQGEASGGAVNIALRDFPDEGYLRISAQIGFNSQVKNGEFLTYPGGGLGFWGTNDDQRLYPDLAGQPWPNPTGTSYGAAPTIYKWSVAAGDSFEVDDGVRVGAFGNFFYEQDASAYNNGKLDSLEQAGVGTPLAPEQFGAGTDFFTELYDVSQGTQSIQWGGMGALGVETENHQLGAKFLYTLVAENQAVRLTDTRGKYFFFPDYDPNVQGSPGYTADTLLSAPWNVLETLDYSQLSTQSFILNGKHTLDFLGPGEDETLPEGLAFGAPTIDWRFSLSKASEDQPDTTQFSSYWIPEFELFPGFTLPQQWVSYPPAQNAFVGWVQHINYYNEESSIQGAVNAKLPFLQWNDREGYVKAGAFVDNVSRVYLQDTWSNNGDPNSSFSSSFQDRWSVVFPEQTGPPNGPHPINQSTVDISYKGAQDIWAVYGMIDLPFNETMNLTTGLRYEGTYMSTTVEPDVDALWIQTSTQTLRNFTGPNLWDTDFNVNRFLPMVGWSWNIDDDLILRTAFAQTLARPNFYELVPVIQYEYVGGPIFIGNPELQMSALDNYDARIDWMPEEEWLISGSVFYKTIDKPIQYVNRFTEGFTYTAPINFPNGSLLGLELESRITMGPILGEDWAGLKFGANFTYMNSSVTLAAEDAEALRVYGVNQTTQPMTATPDYLLNLNAIYDAEESGTQLGVFFTYKGDSLISGANPYTTLLTPAIYQVGYGTLNFTASQQLFIEGLRFSFNAKNLTNPLIKTEYRTNEGINGLNSSYTAGIGLSLSLTYQIAF
jgi:hypothetical protein